MRDENASCGIWARKGQCAENKAFMLAECAASCAEAAAAEAACAECAAAPRETGTAIPSRPSPNQFAGPSLRALPGSIGSPSPRHPPSIAPPRNIPSASGASPPAKLTHQSLTRPHPTPSDAPLCLGHSLAESGECLRNRALMRERCPASCATTAAASATAAELTTGATTEVGVAAMAAEATTSATAAAIHAAATIGAKAEAGTPATAEEALDFNLCQRWAKTGECVIAPPYSTVTPFTRLTPPSHQTLLTPHPTDSTDNPLPRAARLSSVPAQWVWWVAVKGTVGGAGYTAHPHAPPSSQVHQEHAMHGTSPAHTSPAHTSPVHTSPVHTVPVHTSPIHTSPIHNIPVHIPPFTPPSFTPQVRQKTRQIAHSNPHIPRSLHSRAHLHDHTSPIQTSPIRTAGVPRIRSL